jgi:phosphatidylserine decarboxylase
MTIAKEGLPFISPPIVLALLFFGLGLWALAIFFLLAGLAFSFFFRDPKRTIPEKANFLLAPADGKIMKIETIDSHPFFSSPVTVVSIFLSLFDVHFTRAPLSGNVDKIDYRPGHFFPAYKDEARTKNKHNLIYLKGKSSSILIKQIAGIAARRIKCFVKEEERIERGQKIGLIYFGSRVEIFFPSHISLKACLNQKVKAGQTVIGEVKE